MCVYACMSVCVMHTRKGPRLTCGIFRDRSPPFILNLALLFNLQLPVCTDLALQLAGGTTGTAGELSHTWIYMNSRDPNFGHDICTGSTLPTKSPLQSSLIFVQQFC